MKLFVFLFFPLLFWAQEYKPFVGKLIYKVDIFDSTANKAAATTFTTIYTNDTIVRVETQSTQVGGQTIIRHMELNKYYILLNLEGQKFAIQHQGSKDTTESRYTFKKKIGSKKICGLKAKKVIVTDKKSKYQFTCYYFKNFSPKYVEAVRGVYGLPVSYDIQSEEGVYHYELIEMKKEDISRDAFGIPSDYKKVSFDEFMNIISPQN